MYLKKGTSFFVYTMSQVQICACTRICIWRMYITWLLSERVYDESSAAIAGIDGRKRVLLAALSKKGYNKNSTNDFKVWR